MNTQATATLNAARTAAYDKIESEIHMVEAQLATLKAGRISESRRRVEGNRKSRERETSARPEGARSEEGERGNLSAGESGRRSPRRRVRSIREGDSVEDQGRTAVTLAPTPTRVNGSGGRDSRRRAASVGRCRGDASSRRVTCA